MRSIGGLVPLLGALEPSHGGGAAVTLQVPLGEERAATLAEAWIRCWPDRYPLSVDAVRPGASFELGPIAVATSAIRVGHVRWATGEVEAGLGVALRITTPDLTIAVVVGAAPDPALARVCAGADVAVIEVGRVAWPRTDVAWRLRTDEAAELGAGAAALWMFGDDGERVGGPSH
jgi:hypothetical protein